MTRGTELLAEVPDGLTGVRDGYRELHVLKETAVESSLATTTFIEKVARGSKRGLRNAVRESRRREEKDDRVVHVGSDAIGRECELTTSSD